MAQQKKALDAQRQEMALKNMRFNRYLLLRYSLALFFFANIYWLMISFIRLSFYAFLPMVLLLVMILASAEQFRLYGVENAMLRWTPVAIQAQLLVQVLVLVLVIFGQMTQVFPIFANNSSAHFFVFGIVGLGTLLSLLNLRRISRILRNEDRAYQRYQQFVKTI